MGFGTGKIPQKVMKVCHLIIFSSSFLSPKYAILMAVNCSNITAETKRMCAQRCRIYTDINLLHSVPLSFQIFLNDR